MGLQVRNDELLCLHPAKPLRRLPGRFPLFMELLAMLEPGLLVEIGCQRFAEDSFEAKIDGQSTRDWARLVQGTAWRFWSIERNPQSVALARELLIKYQLRQASVIQADGVRALTTLPQLRGVRLAYLDSSDDPDALLRQFRAIEWAPGPVVCLIDDCCPNALQPYDPLPLGKGSRAIPFACAYEGWEVELVEVPLNTLAVLRKDAG